TTNAGERLPGHPLTCPMQLLRGDPAHPGRTSTQRWMHPIPMARLLATLVTPSEDFFNGGALRLFAQLFDLRNRDQSFGPPPLCLAQHSDDRFAMAGNHDGFPPLDLVNEIGQLRFGGRKLNLLHKIMTSLID